MRIISIKENPEFKNTAIKYFQSKWPSVYPKVYEDCIEHTIKSRNPLPQWYLLEKDGDIIGCAGLITNDFISRMDLYPWICALYIDEKHRGNAYATLLIEKAKGDTLNAGFEKMYLSTEHIGYYEKYGFDYIGVGYHPWEEESRIYEINLKKSALKFKIRHETQKDYNEIYRLIQMSFVTAKVKDGDEQDFAVKLRESESYIPDLALVAETDGKLIGHIMLTKTFIGQNDGSKYETLLIAPLSVLLEYRNQGVGSGLIEESIRLAKNMGFKSIFLCGDPDYYSRFGFASITNFGIKSKNGIPEKFVMAYEIEPGILKDISGAVHAY